MEVYNEIYDTVHREMEVCQLHSPPSAYLTPAS